MPPVDEAWRRMNQPMQVWPSVLKTAGQRQWFEMTFNNHTLKYTVTVYGAQDPDNGYPLYIGLHGGGGEDPSTLKDDTGKDWTEEERENQRVKRLGSNDGSWWDMAERYYRLPVEEFAGPKGQSQPGGGKGAVYVAVRGVSSIGKNKKIFDNWNLHAQPESFVLVERMIRNLLLPNPTELYQAIDYSKLLTGAKFLVDPNRVYMLGFSAGGDGAFQFAGRLPDIFAGINAGGGHPNGISFANTTNLPLSLQVGELDATVTGRSRAYGQVHFDLLTRQAKFGHLGFRNSYVHKTCIIKGGKHGEWAQPEVVNSKVPVLSNLRQWYYQPSQPGSDAKEDKVIAPVPWVSKHVRNPYPAVVVWDLSTRPPAPDILSTSPPTVWQPKRFFYWLYIRSEDPAAPYQDTITAWFDKASNSVHVDKATNYLGILLHHRMFNIDKDVDVYIGDTKIQSIRPKVVADIATKTWNYHRDRNYTYATAICFENVEAKWTVKNAETLYDVKTEAVPSKL
jgi:hypothetical protein